VIKPSFYEPSQGTLLKPKPFSITTAATQNQNQRQYPAKTPFMVTFIPPASKSITTAAAKQENNGQTTAPTTTEEVHRNSPPFKL
jgi:hypothetical protein